MDVGDALHVSELAYVELTLADSNQVQSLLRQYFIGLKLQRFHLLNNQRFIGRRDGG
jgi:hypothetical protein